MNADEILRTDGRTMTVTQRGGTGTRFGDHHPDGDPEPMATLNSRRAGRHKPTGQVCTCSSSTVERGAKVPRICVVCGGFADKGLTEDSYRRMRVQLGIEPEELLVSDATLNRIAQQVADLIGPRVVEALGAELARGHKPSTKEAGA
jgi:hypothetical protein